MKNAAFNEIRLDAEHPSVVQLDLKYGDYLWLELQEGSGFLKTGLLRCQVVDITFADIVLTPVE